MVGDRLADVLRHIRQLAGRQGQEAQGDGQLLERFVAQADESAFAALVERHGPMVFGVCRQALARTQDAEDAFQATFLVLARKAASVRKPAALAGWLHRVAVNVARSARSSAAQRKARERQAMVMYSEARAAEVDPGDWQPLLHEEVSALPERYRAAVALCYFEGRSHGEAARALGWPIGTVKGRLARARVLLQSWLALRGVALSGPALAAGLEQTAAFAGAPPALVAQTARAATSFAGHGAGGPATAAAVALAQGALQATSPIKVAFVAAALLFVGGIGVVGAAL